MNELYWINVLGALSNISTLFCMVFGIATIICFVWTIAGAIDENVDEKIHQISKKCLKYFAILLSIFLTINIFVPNKNDLYVIYGIGNVVDYCKKNDGMKELPDNAIKALNLYLKNNIKENGENN